MDVNALNQTQYCIDKIAKRNLYYFYYEEKPKHGILSVIPPKLEFIFVCGNFAVQKKIVEITNYFPKSCFIQCLPPETRYFRLKNIVQRTLLIPGSVLKINISFTPDENRDYNDVLRIRYLKDQEMQIKIFAKVTTKFSLPSEVNFGNVPLGRTAYYKMPIYPHEKTEFSFAILPSNENPCVDIYPRWGYMKPGQSPVIVMIIYRPLKYISLNFQIRIIMSDLCKTPHVINFRAYTRPGFLR
ncbi:Cilia- and flagella-associated protein 221 [Anthophora plagiata]